MSKTDWEPEPLVAAMKVIDIYFWTWWRDNESLKEENLQVQMQINHLFNFQFLPLNSLLVNCHAVTVNSQQRQKQLQNSAVNR